MGDGSRIPGLLYWLALVPTAVFLGLEAQVKRVIGGRLRVYNAVDLSLMTVFYHVVFEDLCNAVFSSADWRDQGARRRCRRTAAALILVFQVGRSVHIAADAIHTYATEIHPEYRMRLPPDLLELIYFLDEDLGHWLLFISYYCLLALLTCCSPDVVVLSRRLPDDQGDVRGIEGGKNGVEEKSRGRSPGPSSNMRYRRPDKLPSEGGQRRVNPPGAAIGVKREHVQVVLAGGLMGATHAVAVIESSHWWLGVFAAVVLGAGAVCTSYRRSREIRATAQRNALVLFSLSVSLTVSLGLALYRVAVGSMTEPSELGGAISVAARIMHCTVTRLHFTILCH